MDPSALTALERDWKAGLLSVRILRIKYSLSEDVIQTLATDHNWGPRAALRDQIDRSAMRALVDRTVSAQESTEHARGDRQDLASYGGTLVDERAAIEAYGQIVASVIQGHQKDIGKARAMANDMMAELESLAPTRIDRDAIEAMAFAVQAENPDLAKALRLDLNPQTVQERMGNLSRRIGMLRSISDIHATYIPLERETWGLNNATDANNVTYDDVLPEAQRLNGQQ